MGFLKWFAAFFGAISAGVAMESFLRHPEMALCGAAVAATTAFIFTNWVKP